MTPKALSREIKFRVYNTDWKMMVLPEDIYYIKFQGEKNEATDVAFNITTTDGMRNNNYWENPEDVVFMQYIGLTDRNEKDIYEGDIIKWKHAENNPKAREDGLGVVHFSSGVFFTGSIKKGQEKYCGINTYSGYPFDANLNIEIIGNIYENPELLN